MARSTRHGSDGEAMQTHLGIAAALFVFGTLTAQQPAPAGEARLAPPTARNAPAPWHDDDALLLSQQLVVRHTRLHGLGRQAGDKAPGRVWESSHASLALFAAGDDGALTMPKTLPHGQPFCLVAKARRGAGEPRRSLLLHSDGTTMFCESPDDDAQPDARFVTARGTAETFADVLRQPGMSESGQLWMWTEQAGASASLLVVDEQGQPLAGAHVLSGIVGFDQDANSAAPAPIPLPIAIAATGADGMVTLRGPLCRTARLSVQRGDRVSIGSRMQITQDGDRLRLVVVERRMLTIRAMANESAAIATLKNIGSAQTQCQASRVIDVDGDGRGEYGFFGELSGKQPVRKDKNGGVGTTTITPPVLSIAFGNVLGRRVERSGYVFQMFLPAADGSAVAEASNGGADGIAVDPERAEQLWCAYAWPVDGTSGRRCFFVNQSGDVLATDNDAQGYFGRDKGPKPNAAFEQGSGGKLDAKPAANQVGGDGARWVVVK